FVFTLQATDPLEVDRWLDGEGTADERAARARDVAADPALAARLEARAAFLHALALGRQGAPALPEATRERVLAALAQPTAAAPARLRLLGRARGWLAAAAAVLVALGAWAGWHGSRAEAVPTPAQLAVRLLDWTPATSEGVAGCADASPSPQTFVLVQDGELEIRACEEPGQAPGVSRALLRRPEELPAVGFVAVPAPGARPGSEIGITEMGQDGVVVFDVSDHGKRVYLAVDGAALRARHPGRGDAWTCAACHGPARQALPNPHRIVLRRAP
ncbi:MAG: hypothetical protein ACKOSS_02980, partial [Planctomycetia bacterium]